MAGAKDGRLATASASAGFHLANSFRGNAHTLHYAYNAASAPALVRVWPAAAAGRTCWPPP